MDIANDPIFQWISQFAYQPSMIYLALIGLMLLSSFGFPLPEEVTLLSVGLLAYFGRNPELFPPPFVGAPTVNREMAMLIASIAVLGSDFLVFSIGRFGGRKILQQAWMKRVFSENTQTKIERWIQKYGDLTCALFRFTPGLRFPGHIALGMMRFSSLKFLFIDGIAVLISVPTQVYLMATYGQIVVGYLKKFKFYLLILVIGLIGYFLIRRLILNRSLKSTP